MLEVRGFPAPRVSALGDVGKMGVDAEAARREEEDVEEKGIGKAEEDEECKGLEKVFVLEGKGGFEVVEGEGEEGE